MATKQTIYIKILDEAIAVYVPAIGEQITKNLFFDFKHFSLMLFLRFFYRYWKEFHS